MVARAAGIVMMAAAAVGLVVRRQEQALERREVSVQGVAYMGVEMVDMEVEFVSAEGKEVVGGVTTE